MRIFGVKTDVMEANIKQQQLTFEKGITNVPSDAVCSDNALEESLGLTYDNGEHRVIQRPVGYITQVTGSSYQGIPTILFVHHIGGVTNYIASYRISSSSYSICWGRVAGTTLAVQGTLNTYGSVPTITSVGKTLVVNTNGAIVYYLWGGTTYKEIGSSIPEITVQFKMVNETPSDYGSPKALSLEGQIDHEMVRRDGSSPTEYYYRLTYDEQTAYENIKTAITGVVELRLNKMKEQKLFCFPFWVRYAVRLFDGSYTHISNPILMMPSVTRNSNIFFSDTEGNPEHLYGRDWTADGLGVCVNYKPICSYLKYKITAPDLSDYSDIISGVDIFVSEEQRVFKLDSDWKLVQPFDPEHNDSMLYDRYTGTSYEVNYTAMTQWNFPPAVSPESWYYYFMLTHLSSAEISSELLDKSVFYQIAEIDNPSNMNDYGDLRDKMRSTTLQNLTTQTQLDVDDYFSHTQMTADFIKGYNMRLHLAGVTRSLFGGFGHFTGALRGSSSNVYIYVYINTDSGERIVSHTASNSYEAFGPWFFYPDPRAKRAEIYTSSGLVKSMQLSEHPRLNGAYYFDGMPNATITMNATTATRPTTNSEPEVLNGRIIVSEANNPYTFNSKGDIFVGQGDVIGMAAQTMSLGEREHGIHPLVVFCQRGISMLRVADDGSYLRSDEISREVCNNCKSITETDGPIYFASEKGLMVLAGKDTQCVSDQLSGKTVSGSNVPFPVFLRDSFIAYDYRDSLLWIFNGQSRYCFVYNIKSGSFSRYDFGAVSNTDTIVANVVNDYPDYLLQSNVSVTSLSRRPNINADATVYTARMVSRPMKLENALALKTITQLCNIRDMNANGGVALTIKASNVLGGDWVTLDSLHGTPWSYYKFEYDFTGMLATDRFSGTLLLSKEVRTNKLRYDHISGGGGSGGGGGEQDDYILLNEPLASINNAYLGMPTESNVAIVWNGSRWVYSSVSGGGGGSSTLSGLDDVIISNLSEGQALVYTNGKWRNYTIPGGGGGTATGIFWGQTYNSETASTVSGDISNTGNITPSITGKNIGTSSLRYNTLYVSSINLGGITITATNGAVHVVNAGFYADQFVSALGLNSSGGGGGGTTLLEPLASINQLNSNPTTSGYGLVWNNGSWGYGPVGGGGTTLVPWMANLNNVNYAPTSGNAGYLHWTGSAYEWTTPQTGGGGTVTSVAMTVPTGLQVSPATAITSSGTFAISFATGYSIPSTTKQDSWDAAATNSHTHSNKSVLDGITSTKVSNWDTAFGWGDHSQAGYLTGHPASFWGQSWNDTNTAITGNMTIDGTISNVTGIYPSSSGSYDLGDSTRTFKRLYLGTNGGNPVYLEYDSTNKAIHIVNAGLYADTYVSALGANSSGGGGGTALNNPLLSINNTLSSNPTSSQINYGLVWNGSSWGYASVVGGSGTVTSVRVQATSPVVSSVDTAQTSTLNTTISLANGYGETKNPYTSKAKNLVLASPASTAGTPSFRALVSDDIPDLSDTYLKLTGGTMSNTNLVTNMNADLLDGQHLSYIITQHTDGSEGFASFPSGYITTYNNHEDYTGDTQNPYTLLSCNQVTMLQCIPGDNNYGAQLAFGFGVPYLAWRTHGGSSTWGAWQKVNAGAADQLTTSRRLWGQQFNGTSDVNGELIFTNETGYKWYFGYGAGGYSGFNLARVNEGGTQTITAVMNSSGYLGLGGEVDPKATIDVPTGGAIKIGGGVISWDDVNNCIKITGYNNTVAGIYANGSVSALGFSAGTSSVDAMTFGYLTVNNRLSFKSSSYTSQIYQDNNGYLHIDGSELIKMGNDLNMDSNSIITGNGNIQCGTGYVYANRFYVGNGRYIYLDGTTLKYNDNGTVRTIAFA